MIRKAAIFLFLIICIASQAKSNKIIELVSETPNAEIHQTIDSIISSISEVEQNALKIPLEKTISQEIGEGFCKLHLLYSTLDINHDWNNEHTRVLLLEKGLQDCSNSNNLPFAILYKYLLARHFLIAKNYPKAFEYLLKAENDIIDPCSYSAQEVWWVLSKTYFDFSEFQKSLSYLNKAIPCMHRDATRTINLHNTRALVKTNLDDKEGSLEDFYLALLTAQDSRDSAWIGILSGNIGAEYQQRGMIKEAIPLIELDYQLSLKHEQWISASNALILLTKMEMAGEKVNVNRIDSMAAVAERISKIHHSMNLDRSLYELKSSIASFKNDYKSAYHLFAKSASLKDSIYQQKDDYLINQAETRAATEHHLNQLALIESERKRELLLRNSIIGLSILVIIILFLLVRMNINRRKEEKKRLILEKENTQQKLENAKDQLDKHLRSIREKNAVIEHFQEEINQLSVRNSEEDEKKNEMIQQLYDSSILTEDDWIEFKRLFEKVHAGFFNQLQQMRSDLTTAEMRFLALLKLGMEINEMAAMLGISPNSVRRTRLRLKTKLELEDVSDLIDLVNEMD